MITLGIIGVVAAMTIPSLMTNIQKHQTVTRLKHTYSLITQAVKLSEADNGDVSGWDMTNSTASNATQASPNYEDSETFAKRYLIPYMKYAYECKSNISYCKPGDRKFLDGSVTNVGISSYFGVRLLNGVVIHFYPRNSLTSIIVDINGSAKPNVIGKDVFYIFIVPTAFQNSYFGNFPSSGVYMYGDGFTREYLMNEIYPCAKSGRKVGLYCGALIKLDGWRISKDYPW